jgi:hypothetical protein
MLGKDMEKLSENMGFPWRKPGEQYGKNIKNMNNIGKHIELPATTQQEFAPVGAL